MIILAFIFAILFWVFAEIIREHVLGWKCEGFKEHMLHVLMIVLIFISATFSSVAWDEIKKSGVKEQVEQSK